MRAKVYRGSSKDENHPYYFITRNIECDISGETDEKNQPYKFVKNIVCKGEIKSWSPFIAEYKSYEGNQEQIRFICPICGSCDCERPEQLKFSDPYFFQGSFKCSKCEAADFNYYSDCFHKGIKQVQQLSIF